MEMKNKILILVFLSFAALGCKKDKVPDGIDFRAEMRTFVQEIASNGRLRNPNFIVIPQNGQELVSLSADASGADATDYLNAIDALSREDLFYGYDKDDAATPSSETNYIRAYLDKAKVAGKTILVTDYASSTSKMDNSYVQNDAAGYIGFAADSRELDQIPSHPSPIHNENADSIRVMADVKNYLYLINPSNYVSRQAFVDAVAATNYDLVIMDLFFNNGTSFTSSEIDAIRRKQNGGTRLVVSYMSVGEAEDYRYYWNPDWKTGDPEWLRKENTQWKGNYKVWYWESEWKDVIFGTSNSYLSKIQDAGFDGVFLDIIDGFEYFEEL